MSVFNDLIEKAKKEEQPQRLLFLFAKATNMMGENSASYKSGTIDPIMCVDKLPEELTSFSSLVEEADGNTKNWDFILVSSLAGTNGVAPTSEETDPFLQKMSNGLAMGENLSQYLILDREENTVIVS